eukprot:CAMPEP_0184700976 /NCGR_PEP_ID=MMETSP0313-20130426/17410_1 /TAXON_ID=2792 /ORGANISM="Porphyridium aerugineum, Strain SAG 1380-2" /LENGTH=179 /DNA_ID=CAMNT_0027160873 /DNA_START=61 /DNA_END=598 /DNA_ORIENTATION=-
MLQSNELIALAVADPGAISKIARTDNDLASKLTQVLAALKSLAMHISHALHSKRHNGKASKAGSSSTLDHGSTLRIHLRAQRNGSRSQRLQQGNSQNRRQIQSEHRRDHAAEDGQERITYRIQGLQKSCALPVGRQPGENDSGGDQVAEMLKKLASPPTTTPSAIELPGITMAQQAAIR